MTFISVADELRKKSFTTVENKFITKYLPILEPVAVKVYLYSLYVYQNNLLSFTALDFANALNISSEQVLQYFKYLEENELVNVFSENPLEVKILDCENVYGKPKKYKPEKYADFTKSAQNILKGRMISTTEYMEYFYLLEDGGFDENALLMIITYCVSYKKDDKIGFAYIKKVIKDFQKDGITTAKKVEERLASYTTSTPDLVKLFSAIGIKREPDLNDDKLFKKWTNEFGFESNSIIFTAKLFKIKTVEKIDAILLELYSNKKFDVKEIEDYYLNKNSVINATYEIAKALGVYIQSVIPYVENYVNVWCNFGYDLQTLIKIANFCFLHEKNSFADANAFIKELYNEGLVSEDSVLDYLDKLNKRDALIKSVLTTCGLTRKVIKFDYESLNNWQRWGFSNEMILEAAKISAGKSNPIAYLNGVLSSWKSKGIFKPSQIDYSIIQSSSNKKNKRKSITEDWQSTINLMKIKSDE